MLLRLTWRILSMVDAFKLQVGEGKTSYALGDCAFSFLLYVSGGGCFYVCCVFLLAFV